MGWILKITTYTFRIIHNISKLLFLTEKSLCPLSHNHHLPEPTSHETFASSAATTSSEGTHQAGRVKITFRSEPRSAAHQRAIIAALTFLMLLLPQQTSLLPTPSISASVPLPLTPAFFCPHAGTRRGSVLPLQHHYCQNAENLRSSIEKWVIRGLSRLWDRTGRAKVKSVIYLLKLINSEAVFFPHFLQIIFFLPN